MAILGSYATLSFLRLVNRSRARPAAAGVPDLVGSRLPGPYHFRARIQSFQAFAAPFPGDSVLPSGPPAPAIPTTETPRFKRSTICSAVSSGTPVREQI